MRGNCGEFDKSSAVHQTNTIQISSYTINNLPANIYIYIYLYIYIHSPNFLPKSLSTPFCQTLSPPNFPTILYI